MRFRKKHIVLHVDVSLCLLILRRESVLITIIILESIAPPCAIPVIGSVKTEISYLFS